MIGGNKIVGLRRDSDSAAEDGMSADEELLLEEYYSSDSATASSVTQSSQPIRTVLIVAAVAWVGFYAWWTLGQDDAASALVELPQWIATLCIPLLLLGTAYLLALRNSHAEADRYAQTANRLKHETMALEQRLASVRQQISGAHSAMQEQASLLENYGASASANLEASAKLISDHAAEAAQHTANAEKAGTELAGQITSLVRALPSLEERAAAMASQLMESSQAMTGRIDALERRLQAVMAISDDARLRTLSATKSLTTQLAQLQEETRSASDEINGMAEATAGRIDVVLDRAKIVLQETGTGLEDHATSLNALIDRSHEALSALGSESIGRFTGQATEMERRLQELNRLVEVQGRLSAGLTDDLSNKLQELDGRFATLETEASERAQRLTGSLSALAGEAERMEQALMAGNASAAELTGRSDTLLKALTASIGEMEAHYPEALGRFDRRIEESRRLLGTAGPDVEKLERAAQQLLDRSREAQSLLDEQSRSFADSLLETQTGLSASREQAAQLREELAQAQDSTTRLIESSGPQLVTALLRVKDTADQATERARVALSRAIPEAVHGLGEASEQAIRRAVDEHATRQIEHLNAVTEHAVEAAHQASERLARQLHTISETSAAIEQRIEEAEQTSGERERNSVSQRSAQVIESLNSTAIDVTKVLSSDVSDTDWAAYLKGDRGVFTRHAVKLLNTGEAREIGLHYDSNTEFREHVNRYIHDFEALIRMVLSGRDGNSMAVTMLSSDLGKLYVALAQAIDRLHC